MKPSQVRCPRCFAPRGRPCITEKGVGRPVHAERRERAEKLTQQAIEAGTEITILRSDRFEQNENIDLRAEYSATLAETAIEQLIEIIEAAEMDETTGEFVISARTPEGVEVAERLQSFAELHSFLREFGFDPESEVEELGFGYGGPIKLSTQEIDQLLVDTEAESLFRRSAFPGTKLFRIETGLLAPEVRIELAEINAELIRFLAKHPHQLYSLEPRRFEQLIEEIFRDFGYATMLTPQSGDGGVDIRAIKKDQVGTLLYLIECKRYSPQNPVGPEIIRSLYGVVEQEHASCGLLVTTSRFTTGAKEVARKTEYKLALHDYQDLVSWLQQYPMATRFR